MRSFVIQIDDAPKLAVQRTFDEIARLLELGAKRLEKLRFYNVS
jgi:hypothetical protein